MDTEEYVMILADLYMFQKYVTSMRHVMFVNGTELLITLARNLKLATVKNIPIWAAN